jgi:hypothetical protein
MLKKPALIVQLEKLALRLMVLLILLVLQEHIQLEVRLTALNAQLAINVTDLLKLLAQQENTH